MLVASCIEHYNSKDTHALRHWKFEGSTDGKQWDLLREHQNDTGTRLLPLL